VTVAAALAIAAAGLLVALRLYGHIETVPTRPILVPVPNGWVPPGAFGPHGAFYFADCLNARILRVTPAGKVTSVAGAGPGGFENGDSGDGGPATDAHFGCPRSPAWDAAGRMFLADLLNNRIRLVDQYGITHAIAGDPNANYPGDGGSALDAGILAPSTVAFDAAGNLYISDRDNERIRRVDTNGTITTVVGTGREGFSGDGGPATSARIDTADTILFDGAGNMYFSDANNNRVRMVDTNGIITTIAGDGKARYAGDGGPATQASLADPNGLAFDPEGNLYIADYDNGVIRKIDRSGIIATVAGTGTKQVVRQYDGPALQAPLGAPIALSMAPDGRHLYVVQDKTPIPVSVLDLRTGRLTTLVDATPPT
jgi:sugar lactone lactonase YvrE